MVIRQGFELAVIQGVEFKQMGQGGRLGHYPIHFHMARKTPDNTLITQNSINELMTRWIVLHSTSHVFVDDNIGYKSIGHGFYLEDATETGKVFSENLGIFARAAIDNDQNPRKVAGILSDNQSDASFAPNDPNRGFPYRSDFRISVRILDHQWLEQLHRQHGRGRGNVRGLLLGCPCRQQRDGRCSG